MDLLKKLIESNCKLKAEYNTKIIPQNFLINEINEYKNKIENIEKQYFQKQKYIKDNIKQETIDKINYYESLLHQNDFFNKLLHRLNFFENKLKIYSKISSHNLTKKDINQLLNLSITNLESNINNNKFKLNKEENPSFSNDYSGRYLNLIYLSNKNKSNTNEFKEKYEKLYIDILKENNIYENELIIKSNPINKSIYESNLNYFEGKNLLSFYHNFYNVMLTKHENIFIQFKNEELIIFCNKDCNKLKDDIAHLTFKLNGKFEFYKSILNKKDEPEINMLNDILNKINDFNDKNIKKENIEVKNEKVEIAEYSSFFQYA